MATNRPNPHITPRARSLRQTQTRSEGLLWGILRARQLCDLKFRRQHPIGPFLADFACVSNHVVVEIDGKCHDATVESDLDREAYFRRQGWDVIRFTAEAVERDAEAVARAIAMQLLPYECKRRSAGGSGMKNVDGPQKPSQ